MDLEFIQICSPPPQNVKLIVSNEYAYVKEQQIQWYYFAKNVEVQNFPPWSCAIVMMYVMTVYIVPCLDCPGYLTGCLFFCCCKDRPEDIRICRGYYYQIQLRIYFPSFSLKAKKLLLGHYFLHKLHEYSPNTTDIFSFIICIFSIKNLLYVNLHLHALLVCVHSVSLKEEMNIGMPCIVSC